VFLVRIHIAFEIMRFVEEREERIGERRAREQAMRRSLGY